MNNLYIRSLFPRRLLPPPLAATEMPGKVLLYTVIHRMWKRTETVCQESRWSDRMRLDYSDYKRRTKYNRETDTLVADHSQYRQRDLYYIPRYEFSLYHWDLRKRNSQPFRAFRYADLGLHTSDDVYISSYSEL